MIHPNIWVIMYYLVNGQVYGDYALCYSQLCVKRVIAAAEMDKKIYRYEVLQPNDEIPPFQRFPAAQDVWKDL
jgi:hypothetical protein